LRVLAATVALAPFGGCSGTVSAPYDGGAIAPVTNALAYGTDAGGNLWSIDLQTFALRHIGKEGANVVLDAIAFDPGNGLLYGVASARNHASTTLYAVDIVTGAAIRQCAAPIGDASGGFSFDAAGHAYVFDNAARKLYMLGLTRCSLSTGVATTPYVDSDLLAFFNRKLLLFALTAAGPPGDLVTVDPTSGKVLAAEKLDVQYLFALFPKGTDTLYGITTDPQKGSSALVQIRPSAAFAHRVALVHDFGRATHGGFLSAAYAANR